ncbi:MAG: hypothetical protein GXO64_04205 [Candidatus Micrarchaeota archaeon]|nr:hypothetical protein [Candidatus Micrarchaeota archaeon]
MRAYVLLAIIILGIFSFAGCTGFNFQLGNVYYSSNPGVKYGISIVSFTTETPVLLPNEEGVFEVKMKNVGSVRSTRGFAELLGLDQSWSRTGKEILPNEDDCKYTNGGRISLLPQDDNTGALGGEYVCTWNYKAPDLSLGEIEFKPIARVYYNYSTTSISSVTIVPKEEMRSFMENGGALKSDIISQTRSPIRLTLNPKSPIKTYQGGKYEFPVEIKIENVGGGTVCLNVEKCKKAQGGYIWNDIILHLELPNGIENIDCPMDEEVHIPGKSQVIGCRLKIVDDVETVTQKYITLYSEYGYFTDKAMTVKVRTSF